MGITLYRLTIMKERKPGPVLYFFTFFDHPFVTEPSHRGTVCLKNPALTDQKGASY
jgi:hypothetical protein